MARLNDPAPPANATASNVSGPSAETVDAVKRRFLRQNRELAKTNSQQSLRIRSLETESSRLLAENLSLREQVLNLQHTISTAATHPSAEVVDAVRLKLEAKISELGSLVAELGDIKKPEEPQCKSQTAATRRSPDERQWRGGLGLQEVHDAMLPTITEGKFYPRQTMNADEISNLLNAPDSQSPDLGPPPVAHFDDVDPVKFDPRPISSSEPHQEEGGENDEPALSINLETRRKRRESNPKLSIRRVSVFQSPPEEKVTEDVSTGKSLRAGAKRKLSTREEEEKHHDGGISADDFKFNRVKSTSDVESDIPLLPLPKENAPERPVLGDKSVNVDIVSPRKKGTSAPAKSDPSKPPTKPKSTRTRITDLRRPALEPIEIPPEPIKESEIHLNSLPPKTPAVDDIFSPPSTEPSTSRPESKETPPPADLNLQLANSEGPTGATGRPSRRARAQVNYAEPNLVSKMRRPTKELVDAVVPGTVAPPPPSRRQSADPAPSTTKKGTTIKSDQDDSADSAWKNLPTATSQDDAAEHQSPLRDKLGRRDNRQTVQSNTTLNSSAAANAISALISGARRKSGLVSLATEDVEDADDAPISVVTASATTAPKPSTSLSSLSSSARAKMGRSISTENQHKDADSASVFDFDESSPVSAISASETSAQPYKHSRSEAVKGSSAARNARRHSSVPSTELKGMHSRSGIANAAGRKGSGDEEGRTGSRNGVRERGERRGTSGNGKESKEESGGGSSSGKERDRAAGRRKSMMV